MLTRYGFTSVFDLGSPWENTRRIRDRIESGETAGPRIRSTGEAREVADGPSARAAAVRLLEGGTDGLKLFAAAPVPPFSTLPDDAFRAAASEAHRRGRPVFAHPTNPAGLLAAVRGGADIIAHTTPQTGPWGDSLVAEMRRKRITLIPTLKIWKHHLRHDRVSAGDLSAETSTGQLRAWLASGGAVVFGTDVGGMDDYDPSEEYALIGEAGMTFRQILASLTTVPAERFGDPDSVGGLLLDSTLISSSWIRLRYRTSVRLPRCDTRSRAGR